MAAPHADQTTPFAAPNGAPATHAAAPAATNQHNNGPIDHNDIEHWTGRFNTVLADAKGHVNQKSPMDARNWSNAFFGCCSPIDTCLVTYCCPCVTFGKTHHRMNKNQNLEGYEPINTSCLLFLAAACFGLHWVPESMQRMEMRKKYHLKGSCLTDIAMACCCALCDLTQQEKETVVREQELAAGGAPAQYAAAETMMYEPKA